MSLASYRAAPSRSEVINNHDRCVNRHSPTNFAPSSEWLLWAGWAFFTSFQEPRWLQTRNSIRIRPPTPLSCRGHTSRVPVGLKGRRVIDYLSNDSIFSPFKQRLVDQLVAFER